MNCKKCGEESGDTTLCFWHDTCPEAQELKATLKIAEVLYGMPETLRERVAQRALSKIRNDQDEMRESASCN